jgi:hypothetical protein
MSYTSPSATRGGALPGLVPVLLQAPPPGRRRNQPLINMESLVSSPVVTQLLRQPSFSNWVNKGSPNPRRSNLRKNGNKINKNNSKSNANKIRNLRQLRALHAFILGNENQNIRYINSLIKKYTLPTRGTPMRRV